MKLFGDVNRNVALTNYFSFIDGVGMGMWNYAILGPYLYELTGNNRWAGYAEGIQGALQALSSLPAGVYADRMRRDSILRATSVIGVIGVLVTLLGIFWVSPFGRHTMTPTNNLDTTGMGKPGEKEDWWVQYVILTAGMGIFGLYMGAWSPPMYALYADSIPSGRRSYYETIRYTISIASLGAGPLTNTVLFYFLSDTWGISQMSIIFAIGMSMHLLSFWALFLFDDNQTLTYNTRSAVSLDEPLPELTSNHARMYNNEETMDEHKRLLMEQAGSADVGDSDEEDDETILGRIRAAEAHKAQYRVFDNLHVWMVPYIITASDILFGMASGMTIKFFPVYFHMKLGLSPIMVNLLYLVDPIVEIGMSFTAQHLSTTLGRVEVLLAAKSFGIVLLFIIAIYDDLWPSHPYILCAIFIIRSSAINSVFPLSRSILMDYTPSEQRARWSSLESVAGFGWSGSAVLGGILIDNYGFDISFHTTAVVQAIALLPYILLLPLVLKESKLLAPQDEFLVAVSTPTQARSSHITNEV